MQIDDKLVIYEKEEVEKIKAEYGIYTISSHKSRKALTLLSSYYSLYPKMEKDAYEVYAKAQRRNKYKLLGRIRGATKFKLVPRPIQPIGKGHNFFIRLNKIGLDRSIISKPRPILLGRSLPSPIPPSITKIELQNDGINIFWKEPRQIINNYSSFKEVNIYLTLYYIYSAKIERALFENYQELTKKLPRYKILKDSFVTSTPIAKIISVIKMPSKEVFTLKYLILPRDVFIPLKYVMQAKMKFQMDTIVVPGEYAPIPSTLSNIEVVTWFANRSKYLETLDKEFEKLNSSVNL